MKATFLNPFGAVLNALKASWIVKLAAVFVVGVPVSFAQEGYSYVSSSFYQLGYNSNTNVPASTDWERQDYVSWFGGNNPCPSNTWYQYTSSYRKRSFDSDPSGFIELELCIVTNNSSFKDKNEEMFWPVLCQADPKIVFNSVDYPLAQWDLLSRIKVAVEIEDFVSDDCYVVNGIFDYANFSGNDWHFSDYIFWLFYDSENVEALLFDVPRPHPVPRSYGSSSKERIYDSDRRVIFAPPDRTVHHSFWAEVDFCDGDDDE